VHALSLLEKQHCCRVTTGSYTGHGGTPTQHHEKPAHCGSASPQRCLRRPLITMSYGESWSSAEAQMRARVLSADEEKSGFGMYSVFMWPGGDAALSIKRDVPVVLKEIGPSDAIFKEVTPFQNEPVYQHKCYGTKMPIDAKDGEEDDEPDWHLVRSAPFSQLSSALKFCTPNCRLEGPYKVRRYPYRFVRVGSNAGD